MRSLAIISVSINVASLTCTAAMPLWLIQPFYVPNYCIFNLYVDLHVNLKQAVMPSGWLVTMLLLRVDTGVNDGRPSQTLMNWCKHDMLGYMLADMTCWGVNLQLETCDSPAGKLGVTVCYDLRFPEIYQLLAWHMGAQIMLVPSAFTVATGVCTAANKGLTLATNVVA